MTRNYGCVGGSIEEAFAFVKKNGLTADSNYPYTAREGGCESSKANKLVATIDGYESVLKDDEDALLKAVSRQPVVVHIDASSKEFVKYKGGIFKGPCTAETTHAMVAVGYGTTFWGTKYWILKNSWGTRWGERGYMRLRRGTKDGKGLCGVTVQPSYPTKASHDPPLAGLSPPDCGFPNI